MIPRAALPAILALSCASIPHLCVANAGADNISASATSHVPTTALRAGIVAGPALAPQHAALALSPVALTAAASNLTGGSGNIVHRVDMTNFTAHVTTFTPQWLWLEAILPQLARLIAGLSFAAIVKFLCMAGNVLVQVSPYPQVKRWENRGCTGEADAAPYVSIMFGGWQWCFYGMFAWLQTSRSGFLILVHSNCLGAFLGTYYMVAFYRHCRNAQALNSMHRYLSAVTAMAVFQMCAMLVLPAERALFLTGLISSFCSFVGAISMLVTLPAVLRCRDSRSIPGLLVTANFLCACVWCVCGWLLNDPLVMGPNIVAVLSSAMCIYLKMVYPSDPKGDDLDEPQDEAHATPTNVTAERKAAEGHAASPEFTPIAMAVPRYGAMGTIGTLDSNAGDKKLIASALPAMPAPVPRADGTGGTF